MESNNYGVHEVTDLRELLNFKVACHTQLKSRLKIVDDSELKTIIEQSIDQGKTTLKHMKEILSTAETQMKNH